MYRSGIGSKVKGKFQHISQRSPWSILLKLQTQHLDDIVAKKQTALMHDLTARDKVSKVKGKFEHIYPLILSKELPITLSLYNQQWATLNKFCTFKGGPNRYIVHKYLENLLV